MNKFHIYKCIVKGGMKAECECVCKTRPKQDAVEKEKVILITLKYTMYKP